jgi:hypothetical protein
MFPFSVDSGQSPLFLCPQFARHHHAMHLEKIEPSPHRERRNNSAYIFHGQCLCNPHSMSSPQTEKCSLNGAQPSLYLLLGSELVGVTALLLSAVGSTGRETGVALSADHLLAVVLGGQGLERRFDDTTTETEDQVQS